jgi:hypothetical protein
MKHLIPLALLILPISPALAQEDVCTLPHAMFTTLQACLPTTHCEEANGKKYCQELPGLCGTGVLQYDCVRPDGTHYNAPITEHPSISIDAIGTAR